MTSITGCQTGASDVVIDRCVADDDDDIRCNALCLHVRKGMAICIDGGCQ